MALHPAPTLKNDCQPVVIPLDTVPDPKQALPAFARRPYCVFFDSAVEHPTLGRYSFLAADPFEVMRCEQSDVAPPRRDDSQVHFAGPLAALAYRLARFAAPTIEGLPPFQGGAAGLFAYDLGRSLERLPAPRIDEFGVPALAVGLYDVVLAIDRVADRGWIISWGFPETDAVRRAQRASMRAEQVRGWLTEPVGSNGPPRVPGARPRLRRGARRHLPVIHRDKGGQAAHGTQDIGFGTRPNVRPSELAPQYPVAGRELLTSNFDRQGYLLAVGRAIEYIQAGDIFQVNLSQRLLCPACDDAVSLYLRLRACNPAPFAGYLDLGDFQVVSASPERFLQLREGAVEARPIKGTRPRTARPEADFYAGDELRQSEKDRAENVMIVDLLRNDLSKVCRSDSVRVAQLCELEQYVFVQHLVSAVRGRLDEGRGPLDLLAAAFPGGSITGAPKVRAMEIIAELEPTARGAYCGSLGYIGFDGSMDTSILIRTITAGRGWWQAQVGGGIVAQSDPADEYDETWHKAEGLLRAMW